MCIRDSISIDRKTNEITDIPANKVRIPEGMISPVSLSTMSTTLPRLPVSRRFFRSSSENLCSLCSVSYTHLDVYKRQAMP